MFSHQTPILIITTLLLAFPGLTTSSPPTPPKLVLFSFDGFRSDFLTATHTPTLYAIAQSSVTGHMKPTFPTKTYPNHHSIATGLYQPYHGVTNNRFIDPRTNESFNVANGSSFWWDSTGTNVPLYIANEVFEAGQRFSGALQWPGSLSTYTAGAAMEGEVNGTSRRHRVHYVTRYNRHLNWTAAIDLVVDRWLLSPVEPANLVFLYFPEPDTTAHDHGPFSSQVRAKLHKIDRMVAYFLSRLTSTSLLEQTNLIFLSDHGMSEILPSRILYLERCTARYPGLHYQMIGVSPVYSIIPLSAPKFAPKSENLTESVQNALNSCARSLFRSKFHVYQQSEIPPEYHYTNNARILSLFLLADDGYEIKYSKSAKDKIPRGNHGFNNSLPSMKPLFIATGPRFKTEWSHPGIFENVDLYPLILEVLDIPRELFPSNGSFERVEEMLVGDEEEEDEDDDDEGGVEDEFEWAKQRVLMEFVLYAAVLMAILFLAFGACVAKFVAARKKMTTTSVLEVKKKNPTTTTTAEQKKYNTMYGDYL